ncbi:hypothetical protein ACWEOE_13525 [Amycolatopsis sp. NPDC004368]
MRVVELEPPSVRTDLIPGQAENSDAQPLDEFIAKVMTLLETRVARRDPERGERQSRRDDHDRRVAARPQVLDERGDEPDRAEHGGGDGGFGSVEEGLGPVPVLQSHDAGHGDQHVEIGVVRRHLPDAREIQVERVKFLRYGEARGDYDPVVAAVNNLDLSGEQASRRDQLAERGRSSSSRIFRSASLPGAG